MDFSSNMCYRRLRVLLILGASTLLFAAASIILTAALVPLRSFNDVETLRLPQSEPSAQTLRTEPIALASFDDSLERKLRMPLVEIREESSPVVAVPSPPAQPPSLDIILLGTAVASTSDESVAWIRARNGDKLVRVGDTFSWLSENPVLKAIEERKIRVEVRDFEIVVEMHQRN